MNLFTWVGILIPFVGTTLGSAMVYLMKDDVMSDKVKRLLSGFAAGIMVAASIWSLLIPAIDQSEETMANLAWMPAAIGFAIGVFFLLFLDSVTPHIHPIDKQREGPESSLRGTTMMVLAVALHNIPEGMSVGVVFAGLISGNQYITMGGALSLSLGIAIQNFPEGAIVSMPLRSEGISKNKAFGIGTFTGVLEPIASVLTILLTHYLLPLLPYLLSFAAGAMMYVVVEELVPSMDDKNSHSNIGTIAFTLGFILMMVLDVALG